MKKQKIKAPLDINSEETAEFAGLEYVSDMKPGIQRIRKGDHFVYVGTDKKIIKDSKTLERIRSLVIPPAYEKVWICPKPNGHLQYTGYDVKGRKQYRYHSRWREVRDETKYNKMVAFAQSLPSIRKRIQHDLSLPGMTKEKVLAAVVNLLEATLIRIGNEEYAKENDSFGLTTFHNRHVTVTGAQITFTFKGKSRKQHNITLNNRRLANIVKRCKELPGHELFEYVNDENQPVSISSTDVNEYLKSISHDSFTSKDFRTWAGTILAIYALQEFEKFDSEVQAKKNIVQAIEKVAKRLGNTPSVCRKCYVHPEVFNAYLDGTLVKIAKQKAEKVLSDNIEKLSPEEAAVLAFLKKRLEKELKPNLLPKS